MAAGIRVIGLLRLIERLQPESQEHSPPAAHRNRRPSSREQVADQGVVDPVRRLSKLKIGGIDNEPTELRHRRPSANWLTHCTK